MATATTEELTRLANSLNVATGAFDDLLTGLVLVNNANQAAANSTLKNVNARTVELDLLQKREERERAYIQLWQTMGSSLTRSISGLGNFTSQLYSSSNAFQAATLTLDTFGDIFKTTTKILSDALGPFQKLFGVGTVLKNIADAGAEIVLSAMKNRLEQARIITDTIQTVGKAGATFGGSIGELMRAAGQSQINVQEFGKFIASSAKDLVGLGQSISRSSSAVGKLGYDVGNANQDLLVLKGSFGELASSAAEYMALQRLTGIDTRREQGKSAQAIADYIRQQNLLTELTGMSVADQRRQAEERRNIAAFNVEASKLDPQARNNLDAALSLIGQQAGPKIQAVALELFSNQGRLINQRSIQLMTTMPGMLEYIQKILSNIQKPTADFQKDLGNTVRDMAPSLRAMFQGFNQAGIFQLAAGKIQNEVIQDIAETAAAFQRNEVSMERFDEIIKDIMARVAAGKVDADTASVADMIKKYNEQKRALDGLAQQNLNTLGSIVTATGTIAKKLIEAEAGVAKFTNLIINPTEGLLPAMRDFRDELKKTIQGIFGARETGEPEIPTGGGLRSLNDTAIQNLITDLERRLLNQTSLLQSQAQESDQDAEILRGQLAAEIAGLRQALNEVNEERRQRRLAAGPTGGRQEGGIATEPTIVGENNQPEAVIPLARGNIPLNINFDPMLRIMEQQREYLEEMVSANNRNMDYLERIYHAVS